VLDPLDMLVFAKVVETSSFSTAARRLGMSRSTASKHVTRLERTLAVRLLNRTTRKLSLTEAGHSVYAHSTRIASEVGDGISLSKTEGAGKAGRQSAPAASCAK